MPDFETPALFTISGTRSVTTLCHHNFSWVLFFGKKKILAVFFEAKRNKQFPPKNKFLLQDSNTFFPSLFFVLYIYVLQKSL